ncbi:MAG: DHH family phosphoesterase, partial [Oscillospiraceae bacterium]|nr:DHH family phosphoesterase [Oscillospiraceae bacterium]
MTGKGWRAFKLVSMLLVVAALGCAYLIFPYDETMFWTMVIIVSFVSIAYLALFRQSEKNLHSFVSEMESQLNLTERDSLYKFPAPALIIDKEGTILWFNKAFTDKIHPEDAYGTNISNLIDIDVSLLTSDTKDNIVEYNSGHYRIIAVTTEKKDERKDDRKDDNDLHVSDFTLLYFQDMTELLELRTKYKNEKAYVMMIMIDNLEDLLSKSKDSDKGHVTMQIDRLVENFVESHRGVVRKNASDRYFAAICEEEIEALEQEQFRSIIEKAHEIQISGHSCVTLSIGIGRGNDLQESEDMAKDALDMTQGRGGDQVAIKDGKDFTFYGGNSQGVGKSTKVKTRIFTTSLINLMHDSDMVIIMGHERSDLDAVGSAAGLAGAIRTLGMRSYVYTNMDTTLSMPIIERLRDNLDDDIDLFISEEMALRIMTENTLVIIVDTSNKKIIDSKPIYENAAKVVYIDHHRQVVDGIDNAVLSLHEPYASSAAEMVTEVIQYFPVSDPLQCYYADALLSGIMLDTKNFITKTGVRTFEAAAYLKKLGADTIAVKLLFSSTAETEILRSRFITT